MAEGFEGLEVYQKACELRQRVYKLVERLPVDEKYVLNQQMRRAALSVTNNIAEGHGSYNWKHNISYLYRSRGSLNELIDDLGACEQQGYFKPEHLQNLRRDIDEVLRLLNGYVNHLHKQLDEYMADKRRSKTKPPRRTPD